MSLVTTLRRLGDATADRLKSSVLTTVDKRMLERIDALPRKNLGELGVDPFGYDPEMVKMITPLMMWLKERWFRVEAHGLEHIPANGRFLLIGNHSGQLPFDAMMIGTTVLSDAPRPRLVRSMVERWSAELPFVSGLFARVGQVVGDPAVCARLLRSDEGVMVFPEGQKGINKLFPQRYQLASFGTGFMRLALETKSPIVPVAVIGAEEQAPAIADIKPLARLLGFPAMPLIFPQLLPLPLPVKYRLWFGEPMEFKGAADEDDDTVASHVKKVKNTLQRMIANGLERRSGLFF
jgi:1-acyl-sn-glycerol-3-phosphate acyltransferase